MLRTSLDRLRRRQQGIGYSLLAVYSLVWLLRKLSAGAIDIHYRYILLQGVPSQRLLKGRFQGAVDVRPLEGAELLDGRLRPQRSIQPAAVGPRQIQRRVARGDVCIVAKRSSRTVGVLWLTFDAFDETEVKALFVVSPKAGMAWDSNLFIVEDARAGSLFVTLWDGANQVLRERGYRWSATQTSAFNGPSLQAHKRLGAFRIGRIIYILIGSAQVTLSTLRPHFHLSGPSGKSPVFVVPPPTP